MACTLNHAQLGDIQGLKLDNQGVVQYLGIQYATLAHRFAGAELKTDDGGKIDATRRGPTVVRPPLACDIEFGFIQKALDKPDDRPMSDLDGLTLDITVPEAALNENNAKLPVLVFIHGGAFIIGDSGAPHYEMAAIVAYSQSIGKPIIGVSINYRLGVAGFLDSNELRFAGVAPNRGILDQKTAFQWVRRNIGGFSGDPTRITAIGQSAGGCSVLHLLDLDLQDESLFDRAICLSGNNLAVASATKRVAQDAYKSVLQCLGIDSTLSNEGQLKALIEISPEDILSKIPMSVPLQPVVEIDQLPSFRSFETHLRSAQHKPPLMIGSTDFDAVVFEVLGLFADRDPGLAQGFARSLIKAIPEEHHARLNSLLSLYGIPETENDDEARIKILQFGTDLKYFATSRHYANHWPSQSWLYYFNESNPWDGPHKGRSSHCLDIAYLFLNFNHLMDDSQKKTATDFARDVISFTNMEEPWGEFHASKDLRVYGAQAESQGAGDKLKTVAGPSKEVQRLWSEIGLDNLSQAWSAYSARS
ncbi:para-nitrobenzyl esterase [Fusarium tjaetaba]|uniref:Para-nitrobenzyl esterase n=1 Tax=Fusarium tjaetaba TaxID=1567544 RepID=A0A8H5W2E2_9HYPO|nr:para-nitrobenzyl esterase [Fusarium tjaetaba]KAF5646487.1 para-nitrobenzyl esterase [Fusarium tjaetaba]